MIPAIVEFVVLIVEIFSTRAYVIIIIIILMAGKK